MPMKQPTTKTIKQLYACSGNRCAYPNCKNSLFADIFLTSNFSEVCHIEASSQGGLRWNVLLTAEERHSFDNLIILCFEHHKIIDDPNKIDLHTVAILKGWKKQHERDIKDKIHKNLPLQRKSAALSKVVNLISKHLNLDKPEDNGINTPETHEKIAFNSINKYKEIIEDNAMFEKQLNNIYAMIENHGNKKIAILKYINDLYKIEKSNYIGSLEAIKNNSDDIIENIENSLYKHIRDSINIDESLDYEEIIAGIRIVLVDAFMRCKILENPNSYHDSTK